MRFGVKYWRSNGCRAAILTIVQIGLLDTVEKLILIFRPPAIGEDFYFVEAGKPGCLDHGTDTAKVDATFAHEPPIIEEISGRSHPVAEMEGEKTVFSSRDSDLFRQIGIPPEVIHVGSNTDEGMVEQITECVRRS